MEDKMSDVAAFDFDGTITVRDTILPFVREVVGTRDFLRGLPAVLAAICAHPLSILDPTATKELLFTRYLRGRRIEDVCATGVRFARESLPRMIRAAAIDRLRWHQAKGHRCVIVTASPELYVAPWASSQGIETIGSQLEINAEGRLTGRHNGPVCYGAEKLHRLRAVVGRGGFNLHAYGDSKGDAELLAAARYAHWRNFPQQED
jgi:phosphatidylglycerophosphatase C